jgi:hypothetical protein
MIVAVDIDFVITRFPDFFKEILEKFNNIVLTSEIKEVGDREENYKYRIEQLRKLNINGGDYDILVVAQGNNWDECGDQKREVCDLLNIDIVFDDEDSYIEKIKEVTNVIQV